MAKGSTQRTGVDYFETFAPVARKESIKFALALAAEQDIFMENDDVDTAFLYGEVNEVICLDQPDEFADKQHNARSVCPTKVCMAQSKRHENGIIVSTHTLKAKGSRVRVPIFVSMCDNRMINLVL